MPVHRLPQHRRGRARRGRDTDAGARRDPAAFDYVRAGSAEEAVAPLAEHGDDAKFLAGGHVAAAADEAPARRRRPSSSTSGASARPLVRPPTPALLRSRSAPSPGTATSSIPTVLRAREVPRARRRGRRPGRRPRRFGAAGADIGGSVAHADPASDLPAVLLALDATLVARSTSSTRDPRSGSSSRACSRRCSSPTNCSPRSGCPSPLPARGRSRSSPSGPSTGPSSAAPSRTAAWAWSTWAVRRCAPPRPKPALAGGASPGRRGRARRRGHQRRRRHPRHQGLPRAPGPRPGLPRPHRGTFTSMSPNGLWRVPWRRHGPDGHEPGCPGCPR